MGMNLCMFHLSDVICACHVMQGITYKFMFTLKLRIRVDHTLVISGSDVRKLAEQPLEFCRVQRCHTADTCPSSPDKLNKLRVLAIKRHDMILAKEKFALIVGSKCTQRTYISSQIC
jgi:hypothetical protein